MKATRKPFPVSSSIVSKRLRTAAAEALLGKGLYWIFQPLNIFEDSVNRALNQLLHGLFETDPQREYILRSILNMSDTSNGGTNKTQIVDDSVKKIGMILAPLLFATTTRETFLSDLKDIFHRAIYVWSQAQRCPQKIVASTKNNDEDYRTYSEFGDPDYLTPANKTAFISGLELSITILFPRVYMPGRPPSLHKGYFLLSTQNVVIAGELEAKDQAERVSHMDEKRTNSTVNRRFSTTSPTSSTSFHQRMRSSGSSPESPKGKNGLTCSKTDSSQALGNPR